MNDRKDAFKAGCGVVWNKLHSKEFILTNNLLFTKSETE